MPTNLPRAAAFSAALLLAFATLGGASEIGANDFRISDMGGDGNNPYDAWLPDVAHDGIHNEYVVVWYGDDNTGGLVDEEHEIFAQRISGATGLPVGTNDVRVSYAGGTGDPDYDAYEPAIAFDSASFQYLIVWSQDTNEGGLVDNEFEIWGRITDRWLNPLFGGNFRISSMGPDGNIAYGAYEPAVAFNPFRQEYLVVWHGDDNAGGLVDNENEIWGQRVSSTGTLVGARFRISDMGGTGSAAYDATSADVAFNSTQREWVVVWSGDDNTGSLVDEEFEIYAQRLDELGAELGGDYRLSDMGGTANTSFGAWYPAIAYNSNADEYLVVWLGDDNVDGLVDGEYEVFGQRINYWLGTLGGNDVRLSDAGGTGNATYQVIWDPDVAFNPADGEYLVTWSGEDTVDGMVNGEWEVFVQALDEDGLEIGANDERISDACDLGNTNGFVYAPAVAADLVNGQFLVVWGGSDNVGGMAPGEFEAMGQLIGGFVFADGFEGGNTSTWSSTSP